MSYPQSIEIGDLAQWRSSHYLSYFGNHVIANGINLACQSLKLFIKLTQWLEKFLLPQTKPHFQWMGVLMDNLTPEIEPRWNGSVDSQRRCQPEMIQDGGRAGGSAVWLCCFPSMLNHWRVTTLRILISHLQKQYFPPCPWTLWGSNERIWECL